MKAKQLKQIHNKEAGLANNLGKIHPGTQTADLLPLCHMLLTLNIQEFNFLLY